MRAIASLFSALLCFLLSSHRNDAKELRERKWKINFYIGAHSQRCFCAPKVSETQKSDNVCVRREKIFPEILRGQCSPHYIRLRVQKNPFDSHPHYESASTDTQTDRQISSRNFRSGTLFFLQNEWTVTDRPLNNDVNITHGRERFQIRLRYKKISPQKRRKRKRYSWKE